MSTTQVTQSPNPAAETPQPAAMLEPEQVVEKVREVRTQIAEVMPLTPKQKKVLHGRKHPSSEVVQESINILGASDGTAQILGKQSEEVRQMVEESNRWTAAEAELRTTLEGVAGANLIRRQRIALVTGQAYNIATQLARDPAYAILLPHLQEIKRLKKLKGRKKAQPAPQPPTPAPQAPAHGVSPEHGVSVDREVVM
jgi:hypothetical protein